LDGIARTLISAFDQVDIVALGEAHGRKLDSDLRIAVVRHPDFAKKARSVVLAAVQTKNQGLGTKDGQRLSFAVVPTKMSPRWSDAATTATTRPTRW